MSAIENLVYRYVSVWTRSRVIQVICVHVSPYQVSHCKCYIMIAVGHIWFSSRVLMGYEEIYF